MRRLRELWEGLVWTIKEKPGYARRPYWAWFEEDCWWALFAVTYFIAWAVGVYLTREEVRWTVDYFKSK